ncbi:MAG: TadE/TadG family type IV pilus assembly protein [Gemmatimonadales bacterium]
MTRTHLRLGGRRGQSLVEFALVVPLLLLMLAGIIEFGRAWNMSQVVTDAARQGARTAAVLNPDPSATVDSVRAVVDAALQSGNVDPTANGVSVVVDNFQAGSNTPVTVTVSVPYQFMIFGPVMALAGQSFNNGTITLRSAAIMRNE